MAPTTRKQIITYVSPAIRAKVEQDCKRLGMQRGRTVTASAYVESVLSKHFSRRAWKRRTP